MIKLNNKKKSKQKVLFFMMNNISDSYRLSNRLDLLSSISGWTTCFNFQKQYTTFYKSNSSHVLGLLPFHGGYCTISRRNRPAAKERQEKKRIIVKSAGETKQRSLAHCILIQACFNRQTPSVGPDFNVAFHRTAAGHYDVTHLRN